MMPDGDNPRVETFMASSSPSNGDTVCIGIDILDDDDYEADGQQFDVHISSVMGPATAPSGPVSIRIQDNNGNIPS